MRDMRPSSRHVHFENIDDSLLQIGYYAYQQRNISDVFTHWNNRQSPGWSAANPISDIRAEGEHCAGGGG
jgi:hypothetical protein